MRIRRILSLLLAMLMLFGTVSESVFVTAMAEQTADDTQVVEIDQPEKESNVVASYEIPVDALQVNEDGGFYLDLSDFEPTEETGATEPEVTEPEATEPEATEPEVTEPEATEPEATEPEATEPEATEPEATEPEATEPEVTEPLTWFEWAEEKQIDLSSLTKEEHGALMQEYHAYRLNALAETGVLAEGALAGVIANNYIEVSVQNNGHFTIGNRIGNPSYSSDDYKILLYGHPERSTSETLIMIDGWYSNYFVADTISYVNNVATATMTIPEFNIKVVQTLTLVKSGSASFADTVQIQYKVMNNDSVSHDVGIRIMIDTMLASNDHATFRVATVGNITDARVFTGSSIPSVYQVYDALENPTTLATGYTYKGSERRPDKIQFCNWGDIVGSGWNHQVSNGDYLGDSAVGIYFNPVTIKANKSSTVRTYYGVSVGDGHSGSDTVTNEQVKLVIKDSQSKSPVADVTVSCTVNGVSQSGTTDSNGVVYLKGSSQGQPVSVTLTKSGYKTTVVSSAMEKNSTYTYYLPKETSNEPLVTAAVLEVGSKKVDILSKTHTFTEDGMGLIEKKGSTGTVKIKVSSNLENCTWLLVQDEVVLQKNSTGVFELKIREDGDNTYIESFKPSGNRYIQCITKDGKKSEKMRFGIKVKASNSVEFKPLRLLNLFPGGSAALASGSIAELFIGNKFEFGPKDTDLKFNVEITDDNTVRVSMNFNPNWDNVPDSKKEMMESLQNEVKNYIKGKGKGDLLGTVGDISKLKVGKVGADFLLCGYGEGKLVNGGVNIDLAFIVAVKGEASYTTQFLVVGVPVYIQVGGELQGQFEGKANLLNAQGVQFAPYDLTLTPSVGVWLEGGVGIKGVVSVGAKGKGTVRLVWDIIQEHTQAELEAQATLVAEALFWSRELPFYKQTWVLYDSNDKEGTVYGGENAVEQLSQIPFRMITREEMNGESAEGGNARGIYDVQILTVNGTRYKFYMTDRGGNQSNRFMLCYAKMVNGVWTNETPVHDDGTLDTYYDVATDGTNIYVVWSNSNKLFDDSTVTVDEMFAAQELCYTTIAADGTIATPLRLTNDNAMDVLPSVTTVGDTAYIAWYHTANGVENNTDTEDNYLYYTSIANGTAEAIDSVNCQNASISSVNAITTNGVPKATIVTNASTSVTFEDNVTRVIDMGDGNVNIVDIQDKIIGKVVSGEIGGEDKAFWMENGNVAYGDSLTDENPTYIFAEDAIPSGISTDNYTVVTTEDSTYFIWTQASAEEEGAVVAMTTVYTDGSWSQAHKLTDLGVGSVSQLDGYLDGEGKLVLAYTVKNVTMAGEAGDEGADGNVSVSTGSREKVVETEKTVSIIDVSFELSDAVPGQTLPLTVDVRNTGNAAIDSVTVSINSDAGENYTKTISGLNLQPGEQTELAISDFALSDSLTTRTAGQDPYQYFVTVSATDSLMSAQEIFEIGYDKLVLYKREMALVENRENIVIALENKSGFAASNVHVRVLADTTDGVLIYDNVFEEVPANGQISIYLDVEELNSTSLFANVTSDCTNSEVSEFTELILSSPVTAATLTVETYGGGQAYPSEPSMYNVGDEIGIFAEADAGYLFDGWYADREIEFVTGDENSPEATIKMPAGDTIVTARFVSETAYDFTLTPETANMIAGGKLRMEAVFASEMETGKVTWYSTDESVAYVDSRGLVTGIGAGSARITASCGEYIHSCIVTVSYVDVTSIQMVQSTYNLAVEEKVKAEVLTDPAEGEYSLAWTSSDESVALVDEYGNITAMGNGIATITATARTNAEVQAQCTVNVVNPVTDISLSQQELSLTLQGEPGQLQVNFEPGDADFGKTITWHVDNEGILELTTSGTYNENVSIKALTTGSVILTARTREGHEASCYVDVRDIVYVDSIEDLQSEHYPYQANLDRTWVYTDETRDFLFVTFSDDTQIHHNDEIVLMDGEGNTVAYGSGSDFCGRSFLVEDSTLQIRLISGSDTEGYYGFRVDNMDVNITADELYVFASNAEYSGKTVKPYIEVYYKNMYLTEGTHYTVSFSNNKAVGTATAKITGIGIFEGVTKKTTFSIVPAYTRISTSVVSKGIKLSWSASKGAGGYWIYRSVDDGEMVKYKTLSSSTKTFTDTKVSSDHFYNYMLVPYKNVKKGKVTTSYMAEPSYVGPVTKLGPTSSLKATISQVDPAGLPYLVDLQWKPTAKAEGYVIYYSYDGKNYYAIDSTDQTACQQYVYDAGKVSFKVVPYTYINGYQVIGGASNVVSTYGLYTPELYVEQGEKGMYLTCYLDNISGTTGVEIYRSVNGGAYKKVKTLKNGKYSFCEWVDTGTKTSGNYYTYKVRMYMTVGNKTYYSPYSGEVTLQYLEAPVISNLKNVDNGMAVSWKKIKGATSYTIGRWYYGGGISEYDEFTYNVTDPAETVHTFVDTEAVDIGVYEYFVTAHSEAANSFSSYSKVGFVVDQAKIMYIQNAKKGTALYWDYLEYAGNFEVWRSVNGGTYKKIKSTSNYYLADTTATTNNNTYTYKVRGYVKNDGFTFYGPFSEEVEVVKMTPPTVKSTKILSTGGVEVKFSPVKDAQRYLVLRTVAGGEVTTLLNLEHDPAVKTYVFTDPDATAKNAAYEYEIIAVRESGGVPSSASTGTTVFHFSAPEVSLENSEKGIQINATVNNYYASHYIIYRSVNGGSFKKLKTVSAEGWGKISYLDKSVIRGKTYAYKVKASSEFVSAQTAEWSEPISCSRVDGIKLTKAVNKPEGIALTWETTKYTPKASGFKIYRATEYGDFELIDLVSAETRTYLDTSVRGELCRYGYKVVLVPAEPQQSVICSGTKTLYWTEAPCMVTAYRVEPTVAYVYWEYEYGASGFEVRYTTGSTSKTVDAMGAWDYTLKKLSATKEYTVSVRSYIMINDTKYYSGWSEPVPVINEYWD